MILIKIFDRNHNILDELYEFDDLKCTWTLNGIGKAEFSISLSSPKCNQINIQFSNHVEVWQDNSRLWGGIIVSRNFSFPKLKVSCYGYLYLFKLVRLRNYSYAQMTYGNLIKTMINDANNRYNTGITIGNIESNSLLTQRLVSNTDVLLDKIQSFIQEANYDIEVDNDRKFNFYLRKGKNKSYYSLEFGGDSDNIVLTPALDQSILSCANNIYSESNNNDTTITSQASDSNSIVLYGQIEGTYSANSGITIQSTLDNYVNAELQRRAYPLNNLSLNVNDSSLCPFSDISIGDSVTVSLKSYWGYTDLLRIVEMEHDFKNSNRIITVGQTIYRPQPPQIKLYTK